MRKLFSCLTAAALVGLLGCQNENNKPGGPGVNDPNQKVTNRGTLTQADNTFELKPPLLETTVKQGQSKTVNLGIDRGRNFSQDVKLEFGDLPKGVKVTPQSQDFKAGMNEVQLTIEAAPDAALGHHTVAINGTPTTGAKASTTMKIEVEKP